jgi:hypothetical protein
MGQVLAAKTCQGVAGFRSGEKKTLAKIAKIAKTAKKSL